MNFKEIDEIQYNLYYKSPNHKKVLFYSSQPGKLVQTACIKNIKQKVYLLFNEGCYGNACPENIYGIFDPMTKKIILNPKDWDVDNIKYVEKIIGYDSNYLFNKTAYFCCGSQISKEISNVN